MSEKKMFCPECGTENKKMHPFCTNCGKKLEEVNNSETKTGYRSKRMFVITLITLFVGLFISYTVNKETFQNLQVRDEVEVVEAEEGENKEKIEDTDEEEENIEEIEEIEESFTDWIVSDEMIDSLTKVTISLSSKNRVEAEITHLILQEEIFRYVFTVKEDEANSTLYEKYYVLDEVEKVEFEVTDYMYGHYKDFLDNYVEEEEYKHTINRLENTVNYQIEAPDLDNLPIEVFPEHSYDYILKKIDYASDMNNYYEDYLIFMDEYELFPQ